MPKVSVLMPVYNEDTSMLNKAIDSVLQQTLRDFELLILDDGSNATLAAYLSDLPNKDERIAVHHRPHGGITKTLNYGIKVAKGEFIARMDADDLCLPTRFGMQAAFLENNPDHFVVGSWAQFINEDGVGSWVKKYPTDHESIVRKLIGHNQFTHAALMFRAAKMRMLRGYDESLPTAQDYDLMLRAALHGKVANLPEVLVKYRYRQNSISWKKRGKQQERSALKIRWAALKRGGFPKWHAIYLLRPLATYVIPKPIKFLVWKTLVWERGSEYKTKKSIAYAEHSLSSKLDLLFKSNLSPKQKARGIAYILLKQKGNVQSYNKNFSKDATVSFVDSLRHQYEPFGQWKFSSSAVAPSRFASCFAYLTLDSLHALDTYTVAQRKQWVSYIQSCQNKNDGLWYEVDKNSKSHDQEYIALQLTTLALSVLEKEGVQPLYPISWLDNQSFPTWLYQRDFSDPWKEGNRILFMGQLLLWHIKHGVKAQRAQNWLDQLNNWLDKTVDPTTGFWGTQLPYHNSNYTAMLGAYHQYILYMLQEKQPPYIHTATTSTLNLLYPDGLFRRYGGGGACEDRDGVEILAQGHPHVDEKTQQQIDKTLHTIYQQLKHTQYSDGGYSYNPYLALRYSGIPLLSCKKGESDIFSTYFKIKTLLRIKPA